MEGELSFLSLLTGSFATPAAENPTVAMIEAAYRRLDLDARYINCDVAPERLADAVRGAVAMGWAGFNCSIPHKIAVTALIDEMAPSAAIIGAVNCVVIRGGRLIGENTDGRGFLMSLSDIVDPKSRSVVLLGAGGAARAIAVELALAGASSICIVNRSARSGEELAALVNDKTSATAIYDPWDETYRIPDGAEIVVNATSIGLHPDVEATPNLALDTLQSGMVVADVIPNPPRTRLIREAEARGCVALDGLGMLVNQGLISIELWTGLAADPVEMRRTLEAIFRA